jgi:hypothetical protein
MLAPFAGGDPVPRHAAVIAVLIIERPMCLECIATKSAVTMVEVERYLEEIGSEIRSPRRRLASG